ncbi:MAG: hypothetical protein KF689_08035 [Gemmatimonadaceae bacterium]|nr:hypothetical protein [Gemmatimonadaceae bacterium]MCW5827451.1 hypothetical protein [Gemmatimonadaceae bacterium]
MTPAKWFRPTAIVLVVWMLVGIAALVADLLTTPEQIAAMPDGQRQLYEARPSWMLGVYAVATVSGLVGAILLARRHRASVAALALSLAAVTVQFGYTLWGLDAIGLLGPAMAIPFPMFIFLVGAFALWVAIKARNEGWLA